MSHRTTPSQYDDHCAEMSAMKMTDPTQIAAKAAYVRWTDGEKYKFLKQVVCQAKGFSNNSRIDYSEIKLPGRSEVAMEMMWIKMKAEIIVAKMVMVASKTGTAAAKNMKLATIPKDLLPNEVKDLIFSQLLNEPRILEICFEFSKCSCGRDCHFTSRLYTSQSVTPRCDDGDGEGLAHCVPERVMLMWTEQTDITLSTLRHLPYINQETRAQFLKKHHFSYLQHPSSSVALNLKEDIFYFGIGTLGDYYNWDPLTIPFEFQRVALDTDWWTELRSEWIFFDNLVEGGFGHVRELIMVVGSYGDGSKRFQKANNSFQEITPDDVLSESESETKMQMESVWRKCAANDFCDEEEEREWDYDSPPERVKELITRSDGHVIKLKFMKLVRSFDPQLPGENDDEEEAEESEAPSSGNSRGSSRSS